MREIGPSGVPIEAGAVLAFNALHLIVMLGLGFLCAWAVVEAERYPVARYLALFALVFVAFHVFAATLAVAIPLAGSVAAWPTLVAGMLAAGGMTAFLLWRHPVLRQELRELPMGDEA